MMEPMGRAFRKYMNNPEISQRYKAMIAMIMEDGDVKHFFQEHQDRLTQEIVDKSYSKLYEYVQEKEKNKSGQGIAEPRL